jgi:hypothetical protein
MTVKLDKSEQDLIILALAKLSLSRPGWHPACITPLAEKLQGKLLYDEFRAHGPDPAPATLPDSGLSGLHDGVLGG